MSFCQYLNQQLDELHLLKHSFYQSWNQGTLSMETLQLYAKEYYHHVAAFPRYISGIHSLCSDIKVRQILLDNLVEEEQGVPRERLTHKAILPKTHALVDGYFNLTQSDFATGLGALYAYESQTPEVAESKIAGLKNYYGVNDDQALAFFTTHIKADEWHRQAVADLIENLNEKSQQKVKEGAMQGAKLLWTFLDGMMETTCTH